MTNNLLWGIKTPAVVLTNEDFNLKKMYQVKFITGGIDSSFSGSVGDAESGGMYLYVVCKTFLSNEKVKITYTGIDDVQRTIPSSGSIDLSGKKQGDIIRVVNEVSLGMDSFVKAKSVDDVVYVSGGMAGQEIEIWGIDLDVSLIGLPIPVPYNYPFQKVKKRVDLIGGKKDSKLVGFRFVATLAYEWIENYDVKAIAKKYSLENNKNRLKPNHITDAKIGKYKDMLTQSQITLIENEFSKWLKNYGYE